MAMQQYVVRLAPITSQPIIVDANSLDAGRLNAIVDNKATVIGIDYFRASEPADLEIAHKIVMEYAKRNNIPETEVAVRARLPKSNVTALKGRKTDDAKLVVAKPEAKDDMSSSTLEQRVQAFHDSQKQPAAHHDTKKKDELANAVQQLQDAHTSVHGKRSSDKQEPAKASAEKPEGATVKRPVEEKAKRPYKRKPASERSAKSRAAYERYVKEISAAVAESPTAMQPVVPGKGVSEADVDEATMQFALKLAKLLKGVM